MARQVVEAASSKQASDIVLLDIRQICSFADYFVICSADSGRQIEAVANEISAQLKKLGGVQHHSEGDADSGWLLLDWGVVIIHIFSPEKRDYYDLDNLWSEASPVLRIH